MDDDDLLPPQREFKSNADFRQMLQIPRAGRADDGEHLYFYVFGTSLCSCISPKSQSQSKTCYEKCEHASGDQVDGRKSSRKLGSDQKKKKPRPKPETEDTADDDESGYR